MFEKDEAKKDANDTLKKLLISLDDKDTKKAKEQKRKLENYLKDNNVDIDETRKEVKEKREEEAKEKDSKVIPHHLYLKEQNYSNRLEYRDIDENGQVLLTKKPILLFLQLSDIESNYLYKKLKSLENLSIQCLCYPIFKYRCNRHGLILSCEICYKAFYECNEFCERMIKYSRLYGYGFKGPQLENPNWSININA